MNKKKYIGLTIGPIRKTLALARKTRELWGASYIFSYLMKNLIKDLISKGIKKENIILPYAGDIEQKAYHYGAGIYPDRLIFRAQDGDFEKVKKVVTDVLSHLGEDIAGQIGDDKKEVKKYISDYFQVYFLEKEISGNISPIIELSPYLDTLELQEKFIPSDENRYLGEFLGKVNKSFLFNDGFKDQDTRETQKERFDSIIEISSRDLRKYDKERYDQKIKDSFGNIGDEDEDIFIENLKKIEKINDNFKTHHKYIAIVQADGDRIGKTLEEIGDNIDRLKDFSKKLMQFAGEAARFIHEYGGTPVYVGGDDLLFFAPIANQDAEIDGEKVPSIFALIDILDSKFKKSFNNASLSFGVSISYYKFPLNEALEQARNLLFEQAKNYPDKDGKKVKNALAFRILKHSGSAFGAAFNKDSGIYRCFKELLNKYGGEEKYLNSIIYNLQLHREIFKHIGKNEEKVRNFLKNSFDEEIHGKFKQFIEDVAKLIFTVYSEIPADYDKKKKFDAIYAVLRTLHFLKRKDNE